MDRPRCVLALACFATPVQAFLATPRRSICIPARRQRGGFSLAAGGDQRDGQRTRPAAAPTSEGSDDANDDEFSWLKSRFNINKDRLVDEKIRKSVEGLEEKRGFFPLGGARRARIWEDEMSPVVVSRDV